MVSEDAVWELTGADVIRGKRVASVLLQGRGGR